MKFLRENAPLLAVGLLGAVGLLFMPLAPKSLWSLENVRKGPFRVVLATTEGRTEVRITLEMAIETPDGFVFRASPIERMRSGAHTVAWAMKIEGMESATLPCFVSGSCTFKIGNANHDTLTIPASDCQAMETLLACSGRTEMKPGQFLDISRSDAIPRPVE